MRTGGVVLVCLLLLPGCLSSLPSGEDPDAGSPPTALAAPGCQSAGFGWLAPAGDVQAAAGPNWTVAADATGHAGIAHLGLRCPSVLLDGERTEALDWAVVGVGVTPSGQAPVQADAYFLVLDQVIGEGPMADWQRAAGFPVTLGTYTWTQTDLQSQTVVTHSLDTGAYAMAARTHVDGPAVDAGARTLALVAVTDRGETIAVGQDNNVVRTGTTGATMTSEGESWYADAATPATPAAWLVTNATFSLEIIP